MLNKDICVNCTSKFTEWSNIDDYRWEIGLVVCHRVYEDKQSYCVRIENGIPGYCHYKFEQSVASGMEEAEDE